MLFSWLVSIPVAFEFWILAFNGSLVITVHYVILLLSRYSIAYLFDCLS